MQTKDGFQLWVESQKEPEIQPKANCEGQDLSVKGRDERQTTAPLTLKSSPREIPAMFCEKHTKKEY